jgi:hypothetical protein
MIQIRFSLSFWARFWIFLDFFLPKIKRGRIGVHVEGAHVHGTFVFEYFLHLLYVHFDSYFALFCICSF